MDIIKSAMPASALREKHPAKRSFQAVRIAVNDELGAVDRMIQAAVPRLTTGGRLAVISFHSLEDRIVKNGFAAFARAAPARRISRCACAGRSPWSGWSTGSPSSPGETELNEPPRPQR